MKIKKPILNSPLRDVNELVFEDGRFERSALADCDVTFEYEERKVVDACCFDHVKFTDSEVLDVEFIDVKFINCDMSVVSFTKCSFIRVEFVNCKLLGAKLNNCLLSDVLIKETNANMLSVAESTLKSVLIDSSELVESYFFECKIKKLGVQDSRLDESYFYETLLSGVDLSTNSIAGIKTDLKCIKGTIIASWQAVYFCDLIGLEVK